MDVKGLINLIGIRAFGVEQPTEVDEEIYLDVLNTVHFELYRKVALINPYVEERFDEVDLSKGSLPLPSAPLRPFPFMIKSVLVEGNRLKQVPFGKIVENDPTFKGSGKAEFWGITARQLFVYPKYEGKAFVHSIEAPKAFKEATLEDEIPYPPAYHDILVDGACAQVLQHDGGLKKGQEASFATARWKQGYSEFYQYLLSLTAEPSRSTYSPI